MQLIHTSGLFSNISDISSAAPVFSTLIHFSPVFPAHRILLSTVLSSDVFYRRQQYFKSTFSSFYITEDIMTIEWPAYFCVRNMFPINKVWLYRIKSHCRLCKKFRGKRDKNADGEIGDFRPHMPRRTMRHSAECFCCCSGNVDSSSVFPI